MSKLSIVVERFRPMRSNSLPQVGRDGVLRRDEKGKAAYTPVIEFTDKATRDAFAARVIAVLLEICPDAFADGDAA
jgi:hypothetical protein